MATDPQLSRYGRNVKDIFGDAVIISWYGSLWKVDASDGPIQLDLPLASAAKIGSEVICKADNSSHPVTIAPSGGNTINGSSSYVLVAQYDTITVFNDGTSDLKIIDKTISVYPSGTDSGYVNSTSVSSGYSVLPTDHVIYVSSMLSDITITLPLISTLTKDKVFTILKADSSAYTVNIMTSGSDRVCKIPADISQYSFNAPYQSVDVIGSVVLSKYFIK